MILQLFNTKCLENHVLTLYLCNTFFFISLGLVRLVSLVSFSKRMEPPGSVLFNFQTNNSKTSSFEISLKGSFEFTKSLASFDFFSCNCCIFSSIEFSEINL